MPGLLDLPAELIEQIYEAYDDLTSWKDRLHLGYFRLTCRYLERSSRTAFKSNWFYSRSIHFLQDPDIERFCAAAKFPDLACATKRIIVNVTDDELRDTETLTLDSTTKQHQTGSAETDGLRALVDPVLLRHEDALLAAFKAYDNTTEILITDIYDCLDFRYPIVPAHLAPPRTVRFPNFRNRDKSICDASSSFDFIMSLLVRAGIKPRMIAVYSEWRSTMRTGMTDAAALLNWKQALSNVEYLDLAFNDDWRNGVSSAEEAGTRIGQQLHDSIESLPMVNQMDLNFNNSNTSLPAWRVSATGPASPKLDHLQIQECTMRFQDLAMFLRKHCSTLKKLVLWHLELHDGDKVQLRDLLEGLRSSSLEYLRCESLWLDDEPMEFPVDRIAFGRDGPDEEDYIWIFKTPFYIFKGVEEVQDGLAQMACSLPRS